MRHLALDVLRGFDMLLMVGMMGVLSTVIGRPLEHSVWSGMTFLDTVFPLFLFIAGASYPFSADRQRAAGLSNARMLLKIVRRMALLVLLGVAYNVLSRGCVLKDVRIASVLGRIGVCWGVAALGYLFFGLRKCLVVSAAILVGYWALQYFVPSPDAQALWVGQTPELHPYWVEQLKEPYYVNGPFSINGSWNSWFDRHFLPGYLMFGGPNYGPAPLPTRMLDPEGLLSTLPAVVTVTLGMLAGAILRDGSLGDRRQALLLAGLGALCAVLAVVWRPWCPVVKNIWTSTFVLLSGAYSFGMLALFHWIVDVLKWRWWILPFQVVGVNALAAYLLDRLIAVPEGPLHVLVCWLLLFFLYRKKTFVKI